MSVNELSQDLTEEFEIPTEHWLYKMDGYLDWRVIGPQINNPYEIAYPDRVLIAMAKHRDIIRSHIKVRCLCDGHEVLLVDNLSLPILTTDHPCLGGITRKLVLGFLEFYNVNEEIEKTIDRIQSEVRAELDKRDLQREQSAASKKTMAQIKAEKEKKLFEKDRKSGSNGQSNMVRIVRR